MKNRIILLAAAVLLAVLLGACGENTENMKGQETGASGTEVNEDMNNEQTNSEQSQDTLLHQASYMTSRSPHLYHQGLFHPRKTAEHRSHDKA